MVGTYTSAIFSNLSDLKAAIEATTTTIPTQVVAYNEDGKQKFMLIKGASLA